MVTVAALYHFASFDAPEALRAPLLDLCERHGIVGTLLLAHEGINGTIAGDKQGILDVIQHIRTLPGCAEVEWKESHAPTPPFVRLKVRVKQEIVTMGQPEIKPSDAKGKYVDPEDWNALIQAPDVVVIDTRNDYEVQIGTFSGAVDPQIETFRDFPQWWSENRDAFLGKRIAMFCTGGIRCEKSTALLRSEGIEDVFHLKGGILNYLETIPEEKSLWSGECFVFDDRVSLTHGLDIGQHELCYGCRRPISVEDRESPEYEQGVSCPACIQDKDFATLERFREREKQIRRAEERGEKHLGRHSTPR